jgi:hypothetical protein
MKIAIIDSGIDIYHRKLKSANIASSSFSINNDCKIINELSMVNDNLGHGTAVAAIIYKHCSEAEITAIKIFDEKLTVNEKVLYTALKWCITNKINIINLSLGISAARPPEELTNLCRLAYDNGIYIIAAANNEVNKDTYPASYPFVLGVTSGTNVKNNEYGFLADSSVEFIANGAIQRVAWKNDGYNITQGSSYACAHLTGIAADCLISSKIESLSELKNELIKKANKEIKPMAIKHKQQNFEYKIIGMDVEKKGEEQFLSKKKFNWLNRIAIFPVSEKEMTSFVKFPDIVQSQITLYIDYPRFSNSIYFDKNKVNYINHIPEDKELILFDTIVLGYYLDQLFEANLNFGNKILELAIKQNKNIFYFDDRLTELINELKTKYSYKGSVYCPKIDKNNLEELAHFNYLPNIKIPVLAVIGTSSKQGKYTTQIRINNILKRASYKVGFLSSEPQGGLHGSSFSFPYGYASTVKIDYSEWNTCISCIMKGIQHYENPHIITTGIQSGLIPRSYNQGDSEYSISAISSLTFLCSVEPDILICAVNPEDTPDDIINTIKVARIYTDAKVIFCVLSPYKRIDENGEESYSKLTTFEYNSIKDEIIRNLNIAVIDIMDESNDEFILAAIENSLT